MCGSRLTKFRDINQARGQLWGHPKEKRLCIGLISTYYYSYSVSSSATTSASRDIRSLDVLIIKTFTYRPTRSGHVPLHPTNFAAFMGV